jgi:hypothetical protein
MQRPATQRDMARDDRWRALVTGYLCALLFTLSDLARVLRNPPALSSPSAAITFVAVAWAHGGLLLGAAMLARGELARVLSPRGVLGDVATGVVDVLVLFGFCVVLADPSVLEGDSRALILGAGLVAIAITRGYMTQLPARARGRTEAAIACIWVLLALIALSTLRTQGPPWMRFALQLVTAAAIASLMPKDLSAARRRFPVVDRAPSVDRVAVAIGLFAVVLFVSSGRLLSNAAWARTALFHKASDASAWLDVIERLNTIHTAHGQRPTLARSVPTTPGTGYGAAAGSDVLILSVDALRADRTDDLHELARVLGPHARFDGAVSPASGTKESIAATSRGRPARALNFETATLARGRILWRDTSPTLAHVLLKAGYRTLTVPTSNIAEPRIGVLSGFDSIWVANFDARSRLPERSPFTQRYVSAEEAIPIVLQAARETPGPLCVWLHTMETHSAYHVRAETDAAAGPPFERYRQAVRESDVRLAELVREFIRIRGKRPVVAVFGDHGEEFGEHGGKYHATTVYAEQVRVALLLAGPGVPAGRHDAPVTTTALPTTLLDLLGIEAPASMIEASWLAPLQGAAAWPTLAVSEVFLDAMHVTGYTSSRYRYLHDRAHDVELLFDSQRDPFEQRDIAATHPEALAGMRSLASAWDDAH